MNQLVALILFLAVSSQFALSQDRSITGRVVDREGQPVVNASVSTFWSANGSKRKSDGTAFDLEDAEQLHEYWGRLGQMEADQATRTNDDGSFTVSLGWRDSVLFAMDKDRTHGCIIELTEASETEGSIVIQLARLATVTGEFRSSVESKSIDWSHAYVELPLSTKNPLASSRIISCGSLEGKLEFRLPPGDYQLDAYAVSDIVEDNIDLRVYPAPTFTVKETDVKLDIGVLELTLAPPDRDDLEAESKREGRWTDYKNHYGEPAPDWHAIDSSGIDRESNIGSLRGRWVLLDFWGPSCAPCLAHGMPKMFDFYEKNRDNIGKFEIIGVCIDFSGDIESIAELNQTIESVQAQVWQGKKIPFPIVLDNTFKTWERYGISGLGSVVLVDPNGKLVAGDETTLQSILDQDEPSAARAYWK